MKHLIVAGLLLGASLTTVAPVVAVEKPMPATFDALLARMLEEGNGKLPGTALVNGEEVPIEVALALLEWAMSHPQPRLGGLTLPSNDAGTGVVPPGDSECFPAGFLIGLRFGFGAPQDALTVTRDEVQPAGVCSFGLQGFQLDYPSFVGAVNGEVRPGNLLDLSCVVGKWAVSTEFCHTGDYDAGSVVGRVGEIKIQVAILFFYVTAQVLVGGSQDVPAAAVTLA